MSRVIIKEGEGITFAVHDVVPAADLLPCHSAYEAIDRLLSSTEMGENFPVLYCSGYSKTALVQGITYHPLIESVHRAFSTHRPIAFSPDMIWIVIMQGLAQHVKLHAEQLRSRLVSHSGTKELGVATTVNPDSPESDWEGLIEAFAAALENEIGVERSGAMLNDFSTTTTLERTVCRIVMMDIYKPFYEYVAYCICGIPQITLQGTPDDWKKLRAKVELLSEFELDFWLPHLRTILDQFERASRGDIDLKHWQNIYKLKKAYGWERINGWMGMFIPYIKDHLSGNFNIINPLFALDYLREEPPQKEGTWFGADVTGITSADLPSGLSIVPFTMKGDIEKKMHLLGGFCGVEQDSDRTLRARLGWAVRPASSADAGRDAMAALPHRQPVSDDIREKKFRELRSGLNMHEVLSADIIEFYTTGDGIHVDHSVGLFRTLEELEIVPAYKSDPILPDGRHYGELSDAEREIFDAPFHEILSRCEEEQDIIDNWLRFFDFNDGTFLAVRMSGAPQIVKRFTYPLIGITFARDFSQAVKKLLA